MSRAPRLKWHMLRRQARRSRLPARQPEPRLQPGRPARSTSSFTADGHVVLPARSDARPRDHRQRPAAAAKRAEIERLRQRAPDGSRSTAAPVPRRDRGACGACGATAPGAVQLDVKAPSRPGAAVLAAPARRRSANGPPLFIAGGCDWAAICGFADAAPGCGGLRSARASIRARSDLDATPVRALGERTLRSAPDASIYYLEGDLVLAALDRGVNLVERFAPWRARSMSGPSMPTGRTCARPAAG